MKERNSCICGLGVKVNSPTLKTTWSIIPNRTAINLFCTCITLQLMFLDTASCIHHTTMNILKRIKLLFVASKGRSTGYEVVKIEIEGRCRPGKCTLKQFSTDLIEGEYGTWEMVVGSEYWICLEGPGNYSDGTKVIIDMDKLVETESGAGHWVGENTPMESGKSPLIMFACTSVALGVAEDSHELECCSTGRRPSSFL